MNDYFKYSVLVIGFAIILAGSLSYQSHQISTGYIAISQQDVEEIQCLAENIYHEARGEELIEHKGVAFVTLNRLADRRYPSTICEVVYQYKQFSWTLQKDVKKIKNKKLFEQIKQLASDIYYHKITKDPTNGATHYWSHKILKKPPYWDKDGYDKIKLPAHYYMKVKP